MTETIAPLLNPWKPITDPVDLKHLGKLIEEAAELSEVSAASAKLCTAAARCIIQGIDEREPVTGKLNREWLEDELADVTATMSLVEKHFNLDIDRILNRALLKREQLRKWYEGMV